jgi:hypothetical protein
MSTKTLRARKKGMVVYTLGDRSRAKANGLALATLDIDGRKDRYLIQGVITIEQERVLRRFMLEFAGNPQEAIDLAMGLWEKEFEIDGDRRFNPADVHP